MAVLSKHIHKKIKASTLIETLVASVLIVLIFGISSMILSKVFKSTLQNNTAALEVRIKQLSYFYQNGKLSNKHRESMGLWTISFSPSIENEVHYLLIEASHSKRDQTIIKIIRDERAQ